MSRGDTSLPFDQYQRYRLVADLIDRVRPEGEILRVLDVGGRTGLLRGFLPEDRVELVDLEACETQGLVLGDGSSLPFADRSFDAVVSFDTLEHIPPQGRRAFVEESRRVAKSWVVHAGPYNGARVEDAEARLRSFLTGKLETSHRYLEEHHGHGLPERRVLEAQLGELGGEVLSVGHANIERWLGLMCLSMYMDRDAPLRSIAAEFHRFYNEALYAHDHDGDVYRHAVVAAFDGAKLPELKGLFSEQAAPAVTTKPITALVKELMRFDVERDAITPEWERLHEVNAALADDLEQHAKALREAREEVVRRKDMSKQLRLDGRDLRTELKLIAQDAQSERKVSAKALRELEDDLGGNIRAREAMEVVVSERDAALGLIEQEMERERSEGREVIATLEADLKENVSSREDLEAIVSERDAALELIEEEMKRERLEGREAIGALKADLQGHREKTGQIEAELALALEGAQSLEGALVKERREIEEERDAYQGEISSHQDVISELSAELARVRGVATKLEQEIETARADFEAVEGDLSADLGEHRRTVKELEGLLQEVYRGALELEGELARERAEVGSMRAEYEEQLGEHRNSLEELEGSVTDAHAEALRLKSELEREREEGLEARDALEADLKGHQALVLELEETTRNNEVALREHEEESARVRVDAERIREDAEEAISALHQDLEGHQRALAERSQEVEGVRGVLVEVERQHELVLQSERENAALEQERLTLDLDAHREVLTVLREELGRNVSAREGVEVDLRRVEQIASEIEADLRGTQDALHNSVREREGVEEELRAVAEELGGERETMVFLRDELRSRWKNLTRAVFGARRKY